MADLTSKQRDDLPSEHFAVPGQRRLPINDATHTRLAWSMLERTDGLSAEEKATARSRILHRAKVLGIDTHEWQPVHAALELQAMSLQMPDVVDHPNRMPFTGTLTRVGVASDNAPSGSGGKRVMITAEAAERAIPSLLGMGINLSADMDGHAPTSKVGLITEAHVDADELKVTGFIYAADFPKEALRIHLQQAQLGFSFEARNLTVEASDVDPLVITDLSFTGAAILMKDKAAYRSTRLAAMAAMAALEKEQFDVTPEELKASLSEVVAGAIAPVTAQLTKLEAAHTALETKVGEFGQHIEAQRAMVAKVEPAAASLEKTAAAMEAAGVGTDATDGQAAILRRMAAAMRADAAAGRIPQNYHHVAPSVQPPQVQVPFAPKWEDSDGYKTMQASMEAMSKALAAAADRHAATETKLADLKAAAEHAKPAPDRKTLPPIVAHLVAKSGLDLPEDGAMLSVGKVDATMKAAGLSADQRFTMKTGLAKAGLVPLNSAQ